MEPYVNRKDHTDAKIIFSLQDQIFGHITGSAILDDGELISVDTIGFLERVHNKW